MGGGRCGVTVRNGYKLEHRERRLDFSGFGGGGFRANKRRLNIKKGLWREGEGTLVQLNLVYLPSSADQVQPKLAQLRFIKSVFLARATGTALLIPSAGLHVSEESGLLSPLSPSMGRFKRLLERF